MILQKYLRKKRFWVVACQVSLLLNIVLCLSGYHFYERARRAESGINKMTIYWHKSNGMFTDALPEILREWENEEDEAVEGGDEERIPLMPERHPGNSQRRTAVRMTQN